VTEEVMQPDTMPTLQTAQLIQ